MSIRVEQMARRAYERELAEAGEQPKDSPLDKVARPEAIRALKRLAKEGPDNISNHDFFALGLDTWVEAQATKKAFREKASDLLERLLGELEKKLA